MCHIWLPKEWREKSVCHPTCHGWPSHVSCSGMGNNDPSDPKLPHWPQRIDACTHKHSLCWWQEIRHLCWAPSGEDTIQRGYHWKGCIGFRAIWCWHPLKSLCCCNGHVPRRGTGLHHHACWTMVIWCILEVHPSSGPRIQQRRCHTNDHKWSILYSAWFCSSSSRWRCKDKKQQQLSNDYFF